VDECVANSKQKTLKCTQRSFQSCEERNSFITRIRLLATCFTVEEFVKYVTGKKVTYFILLRDAVCSISFTVSVEAVSVIRV
jgi:hypothetical protein